MFEIRCVSQIMLMIVKLCMIDGHNNQHKLSD